MTAAGTRTLHLHQFENAAGTSAMERAEQVAKRRESQSARKLHPS
jgi:hypothetical protein